MLYAFEIYKFKEAPEKYQYSLGGDEDYVIIIPESVWLHGSIGLLNKILNYMTTARCTNVSDAYPNSGVKVFITQHS